MARIRRGSSAITPATPEPPAPAPPTGSGRKDRPTPTRREAEAARRQRVNRTLTAREARREASRQNRSERLRALHARDAAPEKGLMRDYVDSRFNIGSFLLPSLVVILAINFLGTAFPRVTVLALALMYLFIVLVLVDCFLLWRGFKRLLAERMPGTPTRGLMMYGINRAVQIRRFRLPAPRVGRGDRI